MNSKYPAVIFGPGGTAKVIAPGGLVSSDGTLAGMAITEPVAFTPSFTNFTLGNGTVDIASWWREGVNMLIKIRVTLGSTSSMGSSPAMTVPDSKSINTSLAAAAETSKVGTGVILDLGAALYDPVAVMNSATEIAFRVIVAAGTQGNLSATIPMTWATGDIFDYSIKLPISGWTMSA